jgi:hypothetical protein
MDSLPPDAVLHIMSYLDTRSLCKLGAVSKKFDFKEYLSKNARETHMENILLSRRRYFIRKTFRQSKLEFKNALLCICSRYCLQDYGGLVKKVRANLRMPTPFVVLFEFPAEKRNYDYSVAFLLDVLEGERIIRVMISDKATPALAKIIREDFSYMEELFKTDGSKNTVFITQSRRANT